MITATVAIGASDGEAIVGYAIELKTPAGTIQVGIDNDGNTYVSSGMEALLLKPLSSNRVIVELLK